METHGDTHHIHDKFYVCLWQLTDNRWWTQGDLAKRSLRSQAKGLQPLMDLPHGLVHPAQQSCIKFHRPSNTLHLCNMNVTRTSVTSATRTARTWEETSVTSATRTACRWFCSVLYLFSPPSAPCYIHPTPPGKHNVTTQTSFRGSMQSALTWQGRQTLQTLTLIFWSRHDHNSQFHASDLRCELRSVSSSWAQW